MKGQLNMAKQEARNHHYIPRFILKNFNDENGQVNYWSLMNNKLEKRKIKSVFKNVDMYRDEILNKDDPTQIETRFSVFEDEISKLIASKILDKDEITINRRELEKLRIFITLSAFRADYRMKQYKEKSFDELTKEILLKYQPDGNFEKLWKKELDYLATCRNYDDIQKTDVVDPIIKQDFINDLMSFYMTIVDARGGEFLMSDVYPTLEIFPIQDCVNIHMHYLLPLSPTRLLLLNHIVFKYGDNGNPVLKAMSYLSQIKGDAIVPPKNNYKVVGSISPDDEYIYRVKKIYQKDVEYINALLLNETKIGIIFRNKERVLSSVSSFNNRGDTKQKFTLLEEELKK